jgi:uncharacterized membrane protein YcjF (UPF0283 family)
MRRAFGVFKPCGWDERLPALSRNQASMNKLLLYTMPLILTVALFLWTWIVSPYSKYGDNWAVLPAVLFFVAIIVWHVGLIITQQERLVLLAYGVAHVAILFEPWIYCLMRISKDSL